MAASTPGGLSEALADFATAVAERETVSSVLHRLSGYCTRLLPMDGVGVLLRDEDGVARFATANDDLGAVLETLEAELGEGPCLECLEHGDPVAIPDLGEATDRYPRFAPRALDHGLRAIHALPMQLRGQRLGVVDLVAQRPVQVAAEDLAAGQMLADVAMAYVVNSRAYAAQVKLAEQLQEALDSRVLIEQAKGKLHDQLGVTTQEAFAVLRDHARSHHRQLHAVAEDVLSGQLRLDGP